MSESGKVLKSIEASTDGIRDMLNRLGELGELAERGVLAELSTIEARLAITAAELFNRCLTVETRIFSRMAG